jgi:hypothetical protein
VAPRLHRCVVDSNDYGLLCMSRTARRSAVPAQMKRAVLRSKDSGAQKGLIKEQEQRKDKRRMVTHRDITQPNEQNLKERLIRFTNSDSPWPVPSMTAAELIGMWRTRQ